MTYAYMIERRWLQKQAQKKGPDELGGHSFQRWLGDWWERKADGWHVDVLLDRDETHCVAIAYRPEDWA